MTVRSEDIPYSGAINDVQRRRLLSKIKAEVLSGTNWRVHSEKDRELTFKTPRTNTAGEEKVTILLGDTCATISSASWLWFSTVEHKRNINLMRIIVNSELGRAGGSPLEENGDKGSNESALANSTNALKENDNNVSEVQSPSMGIEKVLFTVGFVLLGLPLLGIVAAVVNETGETGECRDAIRTILVDPKSAEFDLQKEGTYENGERGMVYRVRAANRQGGFETSTKVCVWNRQGELISYW